MLARADRRAYYTDTVVNIGENNLRLRANARTPQVYRVKIGRDIFADLEILREKLKKIINLELDDRGEIVRFDSNELTIFADIFYIMHVQAGNCEWASTDEMLDALPALPALMIVPELLNVWNNNTRSINVPTKPQPATVRAFSAALYMLRCAELGLSSDDLDCLTVGAVSDMLAEKADDHVTFNLKATPELMDKLFGG